MTSREHARRGEEEIVSHPRMGTTPGKRKSYFRYRGENCDVFSTGSFFWNDANEKVFEANVVPPCYRSLSKIEIAGG